MKSMSGGMADSAGACTEVDTEVMGDDAVAVGVVVCGFLLAFAWGETARAFRIIW